MANTEVDRYTGVDVEDVPSAEWGWSKENHKVIQIGGLLAAVFLLLMLRGNHVGKVEDIFLDRIRGADPRHRRRATGGCAAAAGPGSRIPTAGSASSTDHPFQGGPICMGFPTTA